MSEPFSKLTPAQVERLAKLSEELGETQQEIGKIQQIIGKILIHGYGSHHPDDPMTDNRNALQYELADVIAISMFMAIKGDISRGDLDILAARKLDKLMSNGCYLHHQELLDDSSDA